ncbi:MAG: O-antigen ligase family protein [Pseudomonadota bacterium]
MHSKLVEETFWYGYLLSLIVLSWLTNKYESVAWMQFSALFFAFFALYVLTVLSGGRCHWRAIERARWVIAAMVLSVIWLGLQMLIPTHHQPLQAATSVLAAPTWFTPESVISITPEKTRWLLTSHIFVICLFLMSIGLLDTRLRLKQLLVVLMLIGALHAFIGINALYANIFLVDVQQLDGHFHMARGWYVNRNHFAGFLNLTLIASIAFLLKELLARRRVSFTKHLLDIVVSPRVIYLAAAALVFIAILLSQSRGALASLVLAAAAVFAIARWYEPRARLDWKFIVLAAVIVLLIVANFGADLLQRLSNEFFYIGERSAQWAITWQAIQQAVWFGYGGGSYGTVFQVFREQADLRDVVYNQSHNQYLHIWLEQGILGLLLWLSVMVLTIRHALISLRKTKSTLIAAVLLSSLVVVSAALLQAGVDFNLQLINIRSYFFVAVAIIFAAPYVRQNNLRRRRFRKSGPRKRSSEISG